MTRRTFLATSAALVSGGHLITRNSEASTPACVLTTEQEEGPYYVDYEKIRRDITEGKPGLPIRLQVRIVHARKCNPLANAALDIWHCDAQGIYSGFTANDPNGPPGGPGGGGPRGEGGMPRGFGPPPGPPPDGMGHGPGGPRSRGALDKTRFLRGIQVTNQDGQAEFATIYPGWYAGRAIHIHCKVHTGGQISHTGQFFFPEEITERIAKLQPYAKRLQVHRTTQEEDSIFVDQHGGTSMLTLTRLEKRDDAQGFLAEVTIAVDPDAVPKPVGFGRS